MKYEQVVTVSPERAQAWLKGKHINRNISEITVDAHVRQMAAGAWRTLGVAPLLIGEDGKLRGGQHRCKAVVKFGRPVAMKVLFGADVDDVAAQDNQRPNKAGDIPMICGWVGSVGTKTQANNINAVFQQIAYQETGTTIKTGEKYAWHAGIDGLGEDHLRAVIQKLGTKITAAGKAALVYARPLNPMLVDHIIDDILSHAPIAGIPTTINTLQGRIKKEKTRPWTATAMYFRALRAYFEGEHGLQKIETPNSKANFEFFRKKRQEAGLPVDIFVVR